MKAILPAITFLFFSFSQAQTPTLFVLDAKILKNNKAAIANKDPELLPAYQQLLKDADKALKEGPFSVMEKKNAPPKWR